LVSTSRLRSCSATSRSRPITVTPAALTQVSKPPKRAIVSSTTCSMRVRSATSAATGCASPPCARISAAMSASVAALRATSTTRAPRLAAVSAVARPMPLEAPVTTTTCSDRGFRTILIGCSGTEAHAGMRLASSP
jgi:hypothetical protein